MHDTARLKIAIRSTLNYLVPEVSTKEIRLNLLTTEIMYFNEEKYVFKYKQY
jgi:hypothetical protein